MKHPKADAGSQELDFISIEANECSNCWHNREGHCAMYSCECATDVAHHATVPRWWTSYEDGEKQERRVLKSSRR